MAEIQKADPKARRTALTVVAAGALAGVGILTTASAFRGRFETWVQTDPAGRLPVVITILILLTAGPALGFSLYLWRLGRRIVRAGRYPLPSSHVVRDTPIETGAAASRRGRIMQLLAAGIGLAGLLAAFLLWRLMLVLDRA